MISFIFFDILVMKVLKSYFFIVLWVVYFLWFFFYKEHPIFVSFFQNIKYSEMVLSYVDAFFWIVLSFHVIKVFRIYLEILLTKIFCKFDNKIYELLWESVISFVKISKYIIALYIWLYLAHTPAVFDSFVNIFVSSFFILVFLILFTSFVNSVFKRNLFFKWSKTHLSRNVLSIIHKVALVFVWVIGMITIISSLGYNISALITWAWIGWLAIALAAQKSLTNVFGAITIILNKPFKVWDYVQIWDHVGTVTDIWLTYLELVDKLWHQVMIPNENILSSSVANYSERESRRMDFSIGVVYSTSLEKLKEWVKIIEDILQGYVEEWTLSSYRVHFDMFWDFSLNINATYFSLLNEDYLIFLKQKEKINLEIKRSFKEAGIDMAFPTREIIMKRES